MPVVYNGLMLSGTAQGADHEAWLGFRTSSLNPTHSKLNGMLWVLFIGLVLIPGVKVMPNEPAPPVMEVRAFPCCYSCPIVSVFLTLCLSPVPSCSFPISFLSLYTFTWIFWQDSCQKLWVINLHKFQVLTDLFFFFLQHAHPWCLLWTLFIKLHPVLVSE